MQILSVVVLFSLGVLAQSLPRTTNRSQSAKGKDYNCESYPCLIFEDDFNFLDFDKWEHEINAGGGGNWEFEYYTNNRSNSYTHDGSLFLKPTLTADTFSEEFLTNGVLEIWGSQPGNLCTGNQWYGCERFGSPNNIINPIQSARIRSSRSFSFRYGRVEVVARMPRGDWIWPAIWMMSIHNAYGDWPASGEVDIAESRGNHDLRDEEGHQQGHGHASQTMHWGPDPNYNAYERTRAQKEGDFGTSMHTYRVDWDETAMRFYIDDDLVLNGDPGEGGFWEYGDFHNRFPPQNNPWRYSQSKMAPFDQEFFIILCTAVGGTLGYFPDGWTNAGYQKPWQNFDPNGARDFWNARNLWYPTWNPNENNGEDAALQIESVRVWKLNEDPPY